MRKVLIFFSFIVLLIFLILFLWKTYLKINYEQKILNEWKGSYDYILVPGARIHGEEPSLFLKERLDNAIILYKNNISSKIILSGGYSSSQRKYETEVMKNYLLKYNVLESDILIDNGGLSTYESIYRYQKKFKNKKVIVSTQKIYAYRTLYFMDHLNVNGDVMNCTTGKYRVSFYAYFRELLAPVKGFYLVHSKTKPTYSISELDFENTIKK